MITDVLLDHAAVVPVALAAMVLVCVSPTVRPGGRPGGRPTGNG